MLNNFTFEYPYVLLGITVFILCDIFCKAKMATYYMPHIKLFAKATEHKNLWRMILKYLVIIFALISLASPVKIEQTIPIKKEGINIVLSLDTSGSMKAMGFNTEFLEQNRWQAVQNIVSDFIQKRIHDNIGLVVFGSSVMTASPLSFDNRAQQEIINYLEVGIIGDKTAMIDSLASAITMLKDKTSTSNIIIVLTDGEDNISQTPLSVIIKLANKYNIKIYTIGIGESNSLLLNKISSSTHAKSFNAKSKKDLKTIYDTINEIEKVEIDADKVVLKEYYFFYTLFIALLALSIYIVLINKE